MSLISPRGGLMGNELIDSALDEIKRKIIGSRLSAWSSVEPADQEVQESEPESSVLFRLGTSKYSIYKCSTYIRPWMAHARLQPWTVRQFVIAYALLVYRTSSSIASWGAASREAAGEGGDTKPRRVSAIHAAASTSTTAGPAASSPAPGSMSVTGMPSTMSVFFADAVDDQRVYENLQLSFPRDKTVGELSATERAELLTRIDKLNSSTMTRLAPKKRNPMPSPAFESLAAIRARLCPNPSRGRGSRRPLTAEEDAIRRNECGLIITLGPHKYAVRAALEQLAFWLEDPVVHLWTAEQLIVVYATFIYRIQGTVGNFKANFSADFDEATVGMERKTPDPSQAASASTALVDTSSIASAADHVASTAVASGVAVAPVSVSKEVEAAAKAAAQVAGKWLPKWLRKCQARLTASPTTMAT
ncbi:hypothetical protein BC831DRAFT_155117 [Entophlyctis helioformis]|nr:hypothetical protein BC831DRAFT_155117 [Entophlyctis helioformis]